MSDSVYNLKPREKTKKDKNRKMNPKKYLGPVWTVAVATFDHLIFGFLNKGLL